MSTKRGAKKKTEPEVLIPVLERAVPRRLLDRAGRPIVVYSSEEKRQQEQTVEAALLQCASTPAIARLCKQRHDIGRRRVDMLIFRIRERWAREEEGSRPTNRAAAVRRCMQAIQQARAGVPQMSVDPATGERVQVGWLQKPDNRLGLHYERLLADLQGTRAPVKVEVGVDARLTGALGVVLANLTPGQVAERLARVRERDEKARRYELGTGLPNPGLDA